MALAAVSGTHAVVVPTRLLAYVYHTHLHSSPTVGAPKISRCSTGGERPHRCCHLSNTVEFINRWTAVRPVPICVLIVLEVLKANVQSIYLSLKTFSANPHIWNSLPHIITGKSFSP